MYYRKKPVVVAALRWDGANDRAIDAFIGHATSWQTTGEHDDQLALKTLEGVIVAQRGDWIIRGVKGEFYPCKPDIFEATYEPAESESNRS